MTTIAMSLVNASTVGKPGRSAISDIGADAGAAWPKAQPEIRSATNGIVASGLMLNSLHPDVALHPVRSFSMALREGPLAWGSNSHVSA